MYTNLHKGRASIESRAAFQLVSTSSPTDLIPLQGRMRTIEMNTSSSRQGASRACDSRDQTGYVTEHLRRRDKRKIKVVASQPRNSSSAL